MFAGYRSDRLPFFLQGDHLFGCALPVRTVFQCFGFFTQGFFQCEILFHLVLYILVEFAFAVEINVAGCAETFEYLHVRFLRGEADRFPFVLQGNYFLIFFFPIFE